MSVMFYKARIFDQDISTWDMSNVTDVQNMFRGSLSRIRQVPPRVYKKCKRWEVKSQAKEALTVN
eukprot:scaffold28376_cov54-Attheya_sp.AAC.5